MRITTSYSFSVPKVYNTGTYYKKMNYAGMQNFQAIKPNNDYVDITSSDDENFVSKFLKRSEEDYFILHFENLKEMHEVHRILKDRPDAIAQIHTTPNYYGDLPVHQAANWQWTQEIHRALENQPEIIAQIHTTKNNHGDLPMHNADLPKMEEIHRALKNQPEIIALIHKTKNNDGKLPLHQTSLKEKQEVNKVLKDRPDVLAEIYLTKDNKNHLPVHFFDKIDKKEMQEIEKVFKDQPNVLNKIVSKINREYEEYMDAIELAEEAAEENHISSSSGSDHHKDFEELFHQ